MFIFIIPATELFQKKQVVEKTELTTTCLPDQTHSSFGLRTNANVNNNYVTNKYFYVIILLNIIFLFKIIITFVSVTKDFVLNYISTNKNIKDYCQRVSRQWADDLFQYLFEVLASKSDSFLIEKYNEKKIEQYCFGIIYKSANYPSSTFYQQNISFTNNNCFDADIDILQEVETDINIPINKEIEAYRHELKSNWYDVELFNLYIELGTYKKVEEATGINHLSVRYSVVNFVNEIKKRCEKYY